jgi:phage shock protein PspC (stress-responsive transcriptional regulator)
VRRLRRGEDRKIAGVCSGIADYFRVDPTLVRLLFLGGLLLGASSVIVYLAGWLLMPAPAPVLLPASSAPTAGIGEPSGGPVRPGAVGAAPAGPLGAVPGQDVPTLPSTGTDGPQR